MDGWLQFIPQGFRGEFVIARCYPQLFLKVGLEQCFKNIPAQATDIELFCWFLLELGFLQQFALATDETLVSVAYLNGAFLSWEELLSDAVAVDEKCAYSYENDSVDQGFIQVAFKRPFGWKIAFVCTSSHFVLNSMSGQWWLQVQSPYLPSTHFQATESLSTLALKSPRIKTLSFAWVLLNFMRRSK